MRFAGLLRAGGMMDAVRVYSLLHEVCLELDQADEHAAAAYVDRAMALLRERYGVGTAVDLPEDD
jgi:uncharacterized membrane protein